ncbi:MraY family glycosyltransferase [Algivirga pacifica]|uniref:MraY family glycosyltransferase n=1 Tax=Algivirga pacifica TaxID=1162670 RepID=A0ABP9DJ41_9BACT
MNITLLTLFISIISGITISFLLTKVVITQAIRYNIVDKPRVDRFHKKTTALMGGIAIMLAFLVTMTLAGLTPLWWSIGNIIGILLSVILIFKNHRKASLISSVITVVAAMGSLILLYGYSLEESKFSFLSIGADIIFLTGMFDDKSKAMEPKIKLFFQIIASAIITWIAGDTTLLPAPFNYIFVAIWSIGLMNAFNMIDNMNGLSAGAACLSAALFSLLSFFWFDTPVLGLLSAIIAAVTFGFLPLNFPKARIFMGDSGSMLLGYLIGSLAVLGCWTGKELSFNTLIPFGLIAYPIFDVAFVSINRTRSGRPIYIGGKDHSSHLLVKLGLSPKNAVLTIYGIIMMTGSMTLSLTLLGTFEQIIGVLFVGISLLLLGVHLSRIHDMEYMPKKERVTIERKAPTEERLILKKVSSEH